MVVFGTIKILPKISSEDFFMENTFKRYFHLLDSIFYYYEQANYLENKVISEFYTKQDTLQYFRKDGKKGFIIEGFININIFNIKELESKEYEDNKFL